MLLCEYTMFFLTKHLFIRGFPIFTFTKRLMMNIHIAKSKLGIISYDELRESCCFKYILLKKLVIYAVKLASEND